MKTIQLHGILAKRFGRFFKLEVNSAQEAAHALACQIPAFRAFMLDSERLGYRFAVFNGKKRSQANNISETQLSDTTTAEHIHIVPRVIGAGGKIGGWLQVITGVALIAAGIIGGINPAMIAAGVGMMLGGVASLLAPTPKVDNNNDDGNRANNGFGGAVTTIAQGNPVPILYGERDIGGFVLSAMIISEDKIRGGAAPMTRNGGAVRAFT